VKSVLLQKLDLHQDPSAASKIKKQSQSLIALAFAFSLAEFPKGALTQNRDFASCGQGDPDTPTAPKGAAVNRKVSQWQFTTVQSNQFRGQMVARLWRAAYRAGEKLECDTYGKTQDYTRKTGIEYKQIFAPVGANPDMLDRQKLWNQVEQSELKKTEVSSRRQD
jgi:hypothetical protein